MYPLLYVVDQPIYYAHLPVFWVLLGSTAIKMIVYIPHFDLFVRRNDRAIFVASVGAGITAIAMNALLVPGIGILGAAIATSIAALTMWGLKFYFTVNPRLMARPGPPVSKAP